MVVSIIYNYQGGILKSENRQNRQSYKVSESCQALGRLLRHGGDYGALCLGKGGTDGLWVEGLAVNKIAAIIASINVRKMMASCH